MPVDFDIRKKLGDFNLEVAFKGNVRRLGILGASGCGKSMTLKSIAGIVPVDEGHVIVEGRTLYDSAKKIDLRPQQRNVGYMFQNYALFPTMTVEQNIGAGLKTDKAQKAMRVARMISDFKLQGLEKRLPGQLSGGQQQRVALARMMAYSPDALLFDEPFSAMDAFLKERLRLELLEVLAAYDKTAVFVTHDRDEAYQMCEWLIIMENGHVIASGETRSMFDKPQTVAVAKLTGCKNLSRIEKLGDHRVKALDWNGIELVTADPVTENVKMVGIRAHDFYSINKESQDDVNVIATGQYRISEMPFEWYITLENGIWWKFEKSHNIHANINLVPEYISVRPESILLFEK